MKTKQNNYLQDTLKLHCTYKAFLCIISSMMMPYINYNFITLKLQSFFLKCLCSSMDRAVLSEGTNAGSIPARGKSLALNVNKGIDN